jgi:hypothetical protein
MESRVDGHHLRHRPRVGNSGERRLGPKARDARNRTKKLISGPQADEQVAERETLGDSRGRERE